MWCDQPFSKRNMTTERAVVVDVGDDREVGGGVGGQNLKKKGRKIQIFGGGKSTEMKLLTFKVL